MRNLEILENQGRRVVGGDIEWLTGLIGGQGRGGESIVLGSAAVRRRWRLGIIPGHPCWRVELDGIGVAGDGQQIREWTDAVKPTGAAEDGVAAENGGKTERRENGRRENGVKSQHSTN